MDILIKGMEMPTEHITLEIYKNGEVWEQNWQGDGTLVGKAIPLPPHGQLIDADALEVLSWTEDPTKNFDDGVMFALDKLDALPTIIEAEEGEDDD